MVEIAENVKEEIQLHITAAQSALKRGMKDALITQLKLALDKAENEL